MSKSKGIWAPGTTERILELYYNGTSRKEIANAVGVDINKVISDINRFATKKLSREQVSNLHSKYSKEQIEQVLQLRQQGLKIAEIADKTGMTTGTIRFHLNKSRLTLTPGQKLKNSQRHSGQYVDAVIDLRKRGLTRKEIAATLSIAESSVKYIIEKHDIHLTKEQNIEHAKRGREPSTQIYINSLIALAESKDGKLLSPYQKSNIKCQWLCKKGHIFEMIPNSVQQGQWCPRCSNIISKPQVEIYDFVKELCPDATISNREIISPYELDIWVPSVKLGIEYNGLYWHSDAISGFKSGRDATKARLAHEAGFNYFMIYQDEWTDRKELIEGMIKWRLGKFEGTKLNARDLELRKLENNSLFKEFFEQHHIDGHVNAKFAYGLFHDNKLVACVSYRVSHQNEHEIARLATDQQFSVRGGAAKLIAALKKDIKGPLITYSNNRLSSGGVYKTLGFTEITKTAKPSYYYTDGNIRIWRFRCRRINDPSILAQFPTIEHRERAQAAAGMFSERFFGDRRPLFRIEDCGHRKWMLK